VSKRKKVKKKQRNNFPRRIEEDEGFLERVHPAEIVRRKLRRKSQGEHSFGMNDESRAYICRTAKKKTTLLPARIREVLPGQKIRCYGMYPASSPLHRSLPYHGLSNNTLPPPCSRQQQQRGLGPVSRVCGFLFSLLWRSGGSGALGKPETKLGSLPCSRAERRRRVGVDTLSRHRSGGVLLNCRNLKGPQAVAGLVTSRGVV